MSARDMIGTCRCLLTLLLVVAAPAGVRAQDVTSVALRSAFIYNFVRFTEWPPDVLPPGAAISACVLGDEAVATELARTVKGRQAAGRAVLVSLLRDVDALPVCHVLYVSGIAGQRVSDLLAAVHETPVLTVSDSAGFSSGGGIIQLAIEAGKMRFGIDVASARRARLQISARLLALAHVLSGRAEPDPVQLSANGLARSAGRVESGSGGDRT
jgi:hypothetical protein